MSLTITEKNEIIESAIHIIESDDKLMKKLTSLINRLSNKYNVIDENITNLLNIYHNSINRYKQMYIYDEDNGLTEEEANTENNSIIKNLNNIFENTPIEFLQFGICLIFLTTHPLPQPASAKLKLDFVSGRVLSKI